MQLEAFNLLMAEIYSWKGLSTNYGPLIRVKSWRFQRNVDIVENVEVRGKDK